MHSPAEYLLQEGLTYLLHSNSVGVIPGEGVLSLSRDNSSGQTVSCADTKWRTRSLTIMEERKDVKSMVRNTSEDPKLKRQNVEALISIHQTTYLGAWL